MIWADYLESRNKLNAIYRDQTPSLELFRIKKVEVDMLNNLVKIVGDLSVYPKNPPQKWVAGKFNVAHVGFELFNVKSFEFGHFESVKTVNITVSQNNNLIQFETNSGLKCKAEVFDIYEISGYQNAEDDR